jgi:hypothetical protein
MGVDCVGGRVIVRKDGPSRVWGSAYLVAGGGLLWLVVAQDGVRIVSSIYVGVAFALALGGLGLLWLLPPNLTGSLIASYAQVHDYSPDFSKAERRGWFTAPATLELLNWHVQLGPDGRDIVKVAVIASQQSSDAGLVGWVPLIATTFIHRFNSGIRRIEFRKKQPPHS